jgi:hypothetical protein
VSEDSSCLRQCGHCDRENKRLRFINPYKSKGIILWYRKTGKADDAPKYQPKRLQYPTSEIFKFNPNLRTIRDQVIQIHKNGKFISLYVSVLGFFNRSGKIKDSELGGNVHSPNSV